MATGLQIIENLAEPINRAVIKGSGNDQLATDLNTALSSWFKNNVFPLMTGAAIFVTVLFVFYGSFLYFTAYGDENRATMAKKTLTYAIVGFAIATLAFSIANYSKRLFITQSYEQTHNSTGNAPGAAESTDLNAPVNVEGGTIKENPYETQNIINK